MTSAPHPSMLSRLLHTIIAAFFIANCAASARAESPLKPESPTTAKAPACAPSKALTSTDLHGSWQVTWEAGPPATEWLRLRPNPEFADSVIGETQRGGTRLQLAGDIDDDQLTLEESGDGKTITATWVAPLAQTATPPACTLALQGLWTRDPGAAEVPGQPRERRFTLRKAQGW